jgi:hypothetical protein
VQGRFAISLALIHSLAFIHVSNVCLDNPSAGLLMGAITRHGGAASHPPNRARAGSLQAPQSVVV